MATKVERQTGGDKTARNPVKIIPIAPLKKPDWIRVKAPGSARFLEAETGRQLGPALHHTDDVLCAAFHPEGHSVVTGTRGGMVQRWRVPPPPKTGSVEQIRRWVQEQTGMQLDDQGAIVPTGR